jgi:hypothetical protein
MVGEENNLFADPQILKDIKEEKKQIREKIEHQEIVDQLNQFRIAFYQALFGEKASPYLAAKTLTMFYNNLLVAQAENKVLKNPNVTSFVNDQLAKIKGYQTKIDNFYEREGDIAGYKVAQSKTIAGINKDRKDGYDSHLKKWEKIKEYLNKKQE